MFNPVDSKTNFPKLEESILGLWKSQNVFQRSVEARKEGPRFVFFEGPPFANGSPGIHHVLARAFKDIIVRYKVMKGFYVPRIAGWDTHGLPIELEMEKQLGFSGKNQIEKYGIEEFNKRCRENVFSYVKEWDSLTERIAYWVDLEHAYKTMDNTYIESVWWALKKMWDKGFIYQGYRVTPHCPRCGTSLSSHEVALGYKDDTEDPSVYIKFRVVKGLPDRLAKEEPVFLLAWTTTPWTLPGNTALAVAPEAKYAVVEVDGEYIILADALREPAGLGEYKVAARVKGSELVGVQYEPLYTQIDIRYSQGDKPAYRVIEGDFVSMDEGTGIVHIAPAYGEIDFAVGEKEGLPLVHAVELDGTVTTNLVTGFTPRALEYIQKSEVPVMFGPARRKIDLPGAGKFVKDADKDILNDLKSRGLLLRSETIKHTYPFCWRCESPLLYYAKETWHIKTTAVKERLLSGNEEINWYPEHIKYGRFGDWLENNVDWALSRERYWGTPLPVWRCQSCGAFECIGGMDDLKKKKGFSGFKEPLDLHRPFVDELTFNCSKCKGEMRRVPEVIDCWFDAGAMPFAQFHYPFQNETLLEDGRFPADYICEAIDQTRGWFYSLHAISTLLFDRPCYKNVICLGLILDAKGEKMSKRKGNVVWPWEVINQYGADPLRWYLFTATSPGNQRQFDAKQVQEVSRRFLATLWNVYSFFITYANIDRFTPGKGAKIAPSELDRWIISELNQLIADVDGGLDGYNPTEAGRKIEAFVDDLSNWYVRRSRRRFWKSESDADKLAAYTTLYECLVALTKLLAPFTPFLAEVLYQNLVVAAFPDAPDSVHLADFPVADKAKIDKKLSADTRLAMKVCSLGRAARSQAGIKVRQPLAHLVVSLAGSGERKVLERLKPQILEELNVKELKFVDSEAELAKPGYEVVSEGGHSVAISKEIPPELVAEGVAREIVRRLQTMRRSAGFDIADHIVTYYQGDDYIKRVMADFADYIKQETLSRELAEGVPEEDAFTERHNLSGHDISLGVKRLA
ncbi:MAG TPA: isoleucine--tRNA ligase [Dehalococcoidia bacterium]|nr:isoleucine--tRNA ligase [Dehalococcoidia bacterium]